MNGRSILRWCLPGLVAGMLMAGAAPAWADPHETRDPAEKEIYAVLKDLYENQRRGMMNVPPEDGRLLRVLIEAVNAKHVVEVGTSNGYSGIWICLALRRTGGKLTTFEINAERAALARENFKRAGVDHLVTLIEGDAHEEVPKLDGRVDVVFLDADKSGYIRYLRELLPRVRPGGLILAHNTTNLAAGMRDYLEEVTTNPALETIFLHQHDQGMGVTIKKRRLAPEPSAEAAPESDGRPILGYINHIPPESEDARAERKRRVAERRAGIPVMVHRGDRTTAPENTLEAYAGGMDLGADGFEIDIRRTKDGVLYMFHDDDLGRTAHGSGKVRDLTYYELLSKTPKQVYGTATRETRPPTLAAVLLLARQRAALIHLDVKEPGLQDEIERMLNEADMWEHIVEVNYGNAERLRDHPKVNLIPYKGWWPEGEHARQPDAIRHHLSREGGMVFTKDPRPALEWFEREEKKVPLPDGIRAYWTPDGIVSQTSE